MGMKNKVWQYVPSIVHGKCLWKNNFLFRLNEGLSFLSSLFVMLEIKEMGECPDG